MKSLTDLEKLVSELDNPEKDVILKLVEQVKTSVATKQRIIKLMMDCITDLRLDKKYLEFDLEATKRERVT